MPTETMAPDGLTKAFTAANHEAFVEMAGIDDQKDPLASVKKEEDLRDADQQHRAGGPENSEAFGYGAVRRFAF